MLYSCLALAQAPQIARVEHYSENRGWNEAGLGPVHQIVVSATVTPSGFPTLVFVETDGRREPLTHFPQPRFPDVYAYWQRVTPEPAATRRIVAHRGEARSAPVPAPALMKVQQLPLAKQVRVTGSGTRPQVRWSYPSLQGMDVERIRVGVRGGERVHGRFLSLLYVSGDLPLTTRSFRIPAGVLAAGERYVFQVMLEDLDGGELKNRSLSFSDPYTAIVERAGKSMPAR